MLPFNTIHHFTQHIANSRGSCILRPWCWLTNIFFMILRWSAFLIFLIPYIDGGISDIKNVLPSSWNRKKATLSTSLNGAGFGAHFYKLMVNAMVAHILIINHRMHGYYKDNLKKGKMCKTLGIILNLVLLVLLKSSRLHYKPLSHNEQVLVCCIPGYAVCERGWSLSHETQFYLETTINYVAMSH